MNTDPERMLTLLNNAKQWLQTLPMPPALTDNAIKEIDRQISLQQDKS